MDYSPWSEREIWPFLRVAISLKLQMPHPPKLVCIHVTSIPICINFLSRFRWIKFLMTMDYSPWSEREIWPFLRVVISPKLERSRPPKLVCMHVTSISICINFLSRFRWIKFLMTMDYSPWSEREIWPFLRVVISPKLERSRPPKLVCMHVTSISICINFLSRFRWIKFFDDHGL